MHDKQYREYKSGLAKEQFLKDLEERRAKAGQAPAPAPAAKPAAKSNENELAAVAYALYLAGQKPKEGIITLPEIHNSAWNHKHYVLK
jgi:hypothetical protein